MHHFTHSPVNRLQQSQRLLSSQQQRMLPHWPSSRKLTPTCPTLQCYSHWPTLPAPPHHSACPVVQVALPHQTTFKQLTSPHSHRSPHYKVHYTQAGRAPHLDLAHWEGLPLRYGLVHLLPDLVPQTRILFYLTQPKPHQTTTKFRPLQAHQWVEPSRAPTRLNVRTTFCKVFFTNFRLYSQTRIWSIGFFPPPKPLQADQAPQVSAAIWALRWIRCPRRQVRWWPPPPVTLHWTVRCCWIIPTRAAAVGPVPSPVHRFSLYPPLRMHAIPQYRPPPNQVRTTH